MRPSRATASRSLQASLECAARGKRLCTADELADGVCCGSGCGYAGRFVWSATGCLPPSPPNPPSTHDQCEDWEHHNVDGACKPCPGTIGSDCSRCDNNGTPAWTPFCDAAQGFAGVGGGDKAGHVAALDTVKVPAGLKPGRYVLGFRYDCEATAPVWQQCADVELVN